MCQIKLSFRKISWKCLGLAVIISTSSDVCGWSFAYASYMCINSLDLVNLINRSSTPNPASFLLDGVWDFKDWLQPHMGVIQQHSRYHVYRFTKNSGGIAEMHYKLYSDQPWLPNEGGIQLPGDQLLKVCLCWYA